MKGCGHCGFSGQLVHKGSVVAERGSVDAGPYGEVELDLVWGLSRCPECGGPTLEAYNWSDALNDPADDLPGNVLYPTARDDSAIPPRVRKYLASARKVKGVEPGFFALGIRRVLEAVCDEEGANGPTLVKQLQDLAQKGRIPAGFDHMATQLRELGNLGAHVADVEVESTDVPVIEDFAEAILEYLYRSPAKVEMVRKALDERRRAITAEPEPR